MEVKIILTREINPDFVSKAIMRFTGKDSSHILIEYHCPVDDQMKVFQATGEGVNVKPSDEYFKTHHKMMTIHLDLNCTPGEFASYIDGALGKDYSESQYVGFIFPYKWIQKIVGDGEKEMICSELVARVVEKFTDIRFSIPLDFITPHECFMHIYRKLYS